MANLYDWQTLDYVLAGKPFGRGKNGNTTIGSDGNSYATYTGAINEYTGTLGSAILQNDDVVVIHQTRGTGAGQWQFNRVVSGGGTTSITWSKPNKYAYVTGAQVIRFTEDLVATVNAHSVSGYDGSKGGVRVICAKTSITVNGAINLSSLGFIQTNSAAGGDNGTQGGGTAGPMGGVSTSANGNGGGGGTKTTYESSSGSAGGGGGGHANAGTNGTMSYGGGTHSGSVGVGGSAVGSADLVSINMGGAGGSHGMRNSGYGCAVSGAGGAILILISKSITISATVTSNGGTGYGPGGGLGVSGGGAGGSVLVICETSSLGTNLITASGGACAAPTNFNWYYGGSGGPGSVGRIAVHHKGTVTGTTNPAFTSVEDLKLVEIAGASMIQAL